ncbi:MAG: hypothetical protein WAZ18_02205 [Alphaproteobacteria bacterium]
MKPFAFTFVMLLGLGGITSPALAETLVYKANNHWVAQDDAKPLRALLAKARAGQTRFTVMLPEQGRKLATARLEIIRDLLEREAKQGVILQEAATGNAAGNTVEVVAE